MEKDPFPSLAVFPSQSHHWEQSLSQEKWVSTWFLCSVGSGTCYLRGDLITFLLPCSRLCERKMFPALCSVLTQELHAKLTIYKCVVSWHKCVRSSYQELRTYSVWAGVGLTQARSAINILQAHLLLYNFTVSSALPGKVVKQTHKRHQQVPCEVCSGFAEFTEAQEGVPLLFTQTHTHSHTDSSANSPQTAPKVHFPCLFFKLTAQLQLFKPFCTGELGHSLNLHWERTGGFCWRHEEFDQDLPWFLRLVLVNK